MGDVIVRIKHKLRVVELLITALVALLLLAASAPNVHAPGANDRPAGAISLTH